MFDTYVIEIRPQSRGVTVQAGIIVRDGHRFCFYAATHAFDPLNGRLFRSPKAAETAALRQVSGRKAPSRSGPANEPHHR